MKRQAILAACVYFAADVIIAMLTNTRGRVAQLDIKQFVNTTRQIWTYITTSSALVTCEVDRMRSMHRLSISFRRTFVYNGTRMDMQMRGVFDRLCKQRMTLFGRRTYELLCVENIIHIARDHSCAVFRIESLRDGSNIRYDLRVKNSSIDRRPHPDCRYYLYRVMGPRTEHTIYTPDCQRVVSLRQG
uniref:Lipocalin n=1 Tax=Rhipicephalus zambeziensis TaxID=60191 RepID=A0A224YE02_9ACAR